MGGGLRAARRRGSAAVAALLLPGRTHRQAGETTAERIGAQHLYAVTGIQLLHLNTIFQLAAHDRSELRRAARLLLLPDLVVRMLTGFEGAERSNASTTALLDARTGAWSAELLEAVGLDPALLPPIVPAGHAVGAWRGVAVHTVGSHDTASAFVGVPGVPGSGSVVVSSGTWVLVGAERPAADTSEKARDANFSNEAGALGGVRFLKNVTGFWLLEQCRAARIADELVAVTGTPVDELLVVGGGARICLMNELYGRHAGVPVTVGSPEATALGNAVVQGLALGQFERLEDARRWLATGAEHLVM